MECLYEGCKVEVLENMDYCILHIDFPEDLKNSEFQKIKELKQIEVEKKKKVRDFNFKGVKLFDADFAGIESKGDVNFAHALIIGDANFKNAKLDKDVWFDRAKIVGNISFDEAQIAGSASFYDVKIEGYVSFDDASIGNYVWFEGAQIGGDVSFNQAEIEGSVSYQNAEIGDNVSFHGANIAGSVWFDKVRIDGMAWFDQTRIEGELSFKDAKFSNPKTQEKVCRKAKIIWEKLGDRDKADYHFYHEMEAKRRQKADYIRYPELIAQYPFGYGVYPYRILFSFACAIVIFGFIYWIIEGMSSMALLVDKLRFSFLAIIVPAYGVINAKTGIYGIFTILEAVVGAFTWPTFIVIFARKYMR